MAKIKTRLQKQTRKGHSQATFKNLGLRANASIYSKNQHGEIITTKGQPTGKKTKAKTVIQDRFAQLECMWKKMSKGQKAYFSKFCERHNYFNTKRKRPEDIFKQLGLQYRLNEFLNEAFNLKIELWPISWDEDKVRVMVTISGEYADWHESIARRGLMH